MNNQLTTTTFNKFHNINQRMQKDSDVFMHNKKLEFLYKELYTAPPSLTLNDYECQKVYENKPHYVQWVKLIQKNITSSGEKKEDINLVLSNKFTEDSIIKPKLKTLLDNSNNIHLNDYIIDYIEKYQSLYYIFPYSTSKELYMLLQNFFCVGNCPSYLSNLYIDTGIQSPFEVIMYLRLIVSFTNAFTFFAKDFNNHILNDIYQCDDILINNLMKDIIERSTVTNEKFITEIAGLHEEININLNDIYVYKHGFQLFLDSIDKEKTMGFLL